MDDGIDLEITHELSGEMVTHELSGEMVTHELSGEMVTHELSGGMVWISVQPISDTIWWI